MPIGTGGAILGSALLGGATSLFGARGANDAAQRNAQAAAANTAAANQAVHQALEPSWARNRLGTNAMQQGLRSGNQAWWNQMQPVANQAVPALNNISGMNPNYGGNTQIGGHWDNLRSQNFLQSPDYQFRKKEGLDTLQNSAAAGGAGLYSGNTLRGITDFASNLAAGEYNNWFNRQQGLADRDYGADVANFSRDYGVFSDNYGRDISRNQYLAGQGINALSSGANLNRGTETGIGQAEADYWGRQGQDIINAGQSYANNLMGNAGMQVNTPYVSPWGGINQALQGGLQNYLWAQNAGLWPQQTGAKPGPGAPGNYLYGMA